MPHSNSLNISRFDGPAYSLEPWSLRFVVCILALVLIVLVSGCATHPVAPPIQTPDHTPIQTTSPDISKSGTSDVDRFLNLEVETRRQFRSMAAELLERAHNSSRMPVRLEYLEKAAVAEPDNPEIWLELAENNHLLGIIADAKKNLLDAGTAVRHLADSRSDIPWPRNRYKVDTSRRVAMAWAWLHLDRGEWGEGLKWSKVARRLGASDIEFLLLSGLLEGSGGQLSYAREAAEDLHRLDQSHPGKLWIQAVSEHRKGRFREAFNLIMDLIPDKDHAWRCFRDMALIAESVGQWEQARRWYLDSAAALPLPDKGCITAVRGSRLDINSDIPEQLFWLTFGRHFAAGSISAFANYAYANFESADSSEDMSYWCAAVLETTGICTRKGIDDPWAQRARGLVLIDSGIHHRGITELLVSREKFANLDEENAGIEASLGHAMMVQNKFKEAMKYLQAAVRLDPNNARAWSEYGMAQVMAGATEEAIEALTNGLSLDPGLIEPWYNRGLIYLHAHQYEKAQSDLGEAAKLAPDNEEIRQLLQRIHQKLKTQ